MKQKQLPIGIQTFSQIIDDDLLYIDKTGIALDLIEHNKYVFLSRPRRFGKSLFLDTLKNIFQSNKHLFKNLLIYDHYNWDKKYPVINLSFAEGIVHSEQELADKWEEILQQNETRLGLDCATKNYDRRCFSALIRAACEKYQEKVVVLIDEYDKPILDNLEHPEIALKLQDELRSYYSVIKGSDEFLRFAFLTGVSKFSKASIFSGLNNIRDISLDKRYGNICGYTQNDIESTFTPYLQDVDLEKLKRWYNGYFFLADRVYNPFDILLFIDSDYLYKNYWFESGTPSFLIHLIQQNNYFLPRLSAISMGEELVNSFDLDKINIETLLFQSGYLTIDTMTERPRGGWQYQLKIPNKEVQISLNDILINYLTNQVMEKSAYQDQLLDYLRLAQLEKIKETLESLFAAIPYNNYVNNTISSYEGYYASVIYAYFASLGIKIIAEDITNQGRIDLSVHIDDIIYIIEFKVGRENALQQIITKNYQQKYLAQDKEIILLGINFDEQKRNIDVFEWEKYYHSPL